jgi:polysaccharide export outer membrane protein
LRRRHSTLCKEQQAAAAGAVSWRRRAAIGVLLGCSAAIFTGCQPLPEVDRKLPTTPTTVSIPAPYRLQVGDQLDIRFRHNAELDDTATVQPDGRFQLRMAPDVIASGLTLSEITQSLNDQYRQELVDPAVTVILRTALPARFYVGGEVNNPGEYLVLGPPLTLVQAVARAGGLKNSANPDQVVLARRSSGNQPELYSVSFNDATTGVDPAADVVLQPYDALFVPRTKVANIYLFFQQSIQQFLPSSFGLTKGF